MKKSSTNHALRAVTALIMIVVLGATVVGCTQKEELTLLFFYEAACPACEESQRMEELSGRVVSLARSASHIEAETYDIYKSDGIKVLEDALADSDVNLTSVAFPVLLVNGEVVVGEEAIVAKVNEIHAEEER